MTIDELIEIAKQSAEATQEAFQSKVKEREKVWEAEADRQRLGMREFLDRSYNI